MLVMDRLLTQIKQCEQVGSSDKMAADIFIPNADCDILVVVAGLVHSPYGFQIKSPSFLIQESLLHVYNYIIDFTGNHAINPECNMKMRRYKLL